MLSVVGESGSGKSTLARLILGLDRPSAGNVFYRGEDVARFVGAKRRQFRREVQAVFQDPYAIFNPFYTVDRVLAQPLRRFHLASSLHEAQQRMEDSLRAVDLRPRDVLGRYPHQLSGGERQRVMLARLHLLRPQLVIADEPVSMIDAALRTMFLNILLDFRDAGMSCLFITHNLETSYYLGGNALVLYQGRVVERAPIDRILHAPKHPYTQMLVSSIPVPDPKKRWKTSLPESAIESGETVGSAGCPFLVRCPYAMEVCRRQDPPMMSVGDGQEAACFLLADRGGVRGSMAPMCKAEESG